MGLSSFCVGPTSKWNPTLATCGFCLLHHLHPYSNTHISCVPVRLLPGPYASLTISSLWSPGSAARHLLTCLTHSLHAFLETWAVFQHLTFPELWAVPYVHPDHPFSEASPPQKLRCLMYPHLTFRNLGVLGSHQSLGFLVSIERSLSLPTVFDSLLAHLSTHHSIPLPSLCP